MPKVQVCLSIKQAMLLTVVYSHKTPDTRFPRFLLSNHFTSNYEKFSSVKERMGDARAIISDVSHQDIDKWVRTSTFTNELEEVISMAIPVYFFSTFSEPDLTRVYSL